MLILKIIVWLPPAISIPLLVFFMTRPHVFRATFPHSFPQLLEILMYYLPAFTLAMYSYLYIRYTRLRKQIIFAGIIYVLPTLVIWLLAFAYSGFSGW